MSHLPIQHRNKTTPGRAVSWLIVVESYIGKPNEGQLTAVKMGHVQTTIGKLIISYIGKPNEGQLTAVKMGHVQTTIGKLITWAQVRSGTRSGIFHYMPDGYVLLTLVVC